MLSVFWQTTVSQNGLWAWGSPSQEKVLRALGLMKPFRQRLDKFKNVKLKTTLLSHFLKSWRYEVYTLQGRYHRCMWSLPYKWKWMEWGYQRWPTDWYRSVSQNSVLRGLYGGQGLSLFNSLRGDTLSDTKISSETLSSKNIKNVKTC